jgi:Spy/CpxP family protein refolding chaperone
VISSATRAKLLVFAVFLIGGLTGALIDNLYETRIRERDSRRQPQQQVNQIYDLLELTPEQRQQFQSIMDSSRPDFEKLFAENRKLVAPNNRKIAELQEQTRVKIRAILTEEQAKKYNEVNEASDRRRQQRRPPPPRTP